MAAWVPVVKSLCEDLDERRVGLNGRQHPILFRKQTPVVQRELLMVNSELDWSWGKVRRSKNCSITRSAAMDHIVF